MSMLDVTIADYTLTHYVEGKGQVEEVSLTMLRKHYDFWAGIAKEENDPDAKSYAAHLSELLAGQGVQV